MVDGVGRFRGRPVPVLIKDIDRLAREIKGDESPAE
jgi:hypothetical protein